MRPVYVGDVAAGLAHLLDNEVGGEMVELFGPREYHFAALIAFFSDIAKRKIRLFILPKQVLKYNYRYLSR
jgi:NADH dehydrogenase (ubiquinone) 1 alpha subcomplex subunit 9